MRLIEVAIDVYAVYIRVGMDEFYLGTYGLTELEQVKNIHRSVTEDL